MDKKITPQKKVEQNELQITLLKRFELTSYVMGYHAYKNRWTPVKDKMLKAIVEPKNKHDKFAVAIMKDDFFFYQNDLHLFTNNTTKQNKKAM